MLTNRKEWYPELSDTGSIHPLEILVLESLPGTSPHLKYRAMVGHRAFRELMQKEAI